MLHELEQLVKVHVGEEPARVIPDGQCLLRRGSAEALARRNLLPELRVSLSDRARRLVVENPEGRQPTQGWRSRDPLRDQEMADHPVAEVACDHLAKRWPARLAALGDLLGIVEQAADKRAGSTRMAQLGGQRGWILGHHQVAASRETGAGGKLEVESA